MFKDETLLTADFPDALETAIATVNFAYDSPEQLLGADVTLFEELDQIVFAYFNRDDVFYVNKAGRSMLSPKCSTLDSLKSRPPPIFWLDDDRNFRRSDQRVLETGRAHVGIRELVALHWGKSWLQGVKLPIQSRKGKPLALLFAGTQVPGSQQIRQIASQYQFIPSAIGEN